MARPCFDFSEFVSADNDRIPHAGFIFLLALIGFGTKAGLAPLHVWLPEAHPVAPSHVSAVMSGVMIKTGIYGLLRVLTFLGPPPAWWGWTLVGLGVISGIFGVLLALAQHDLKRLLAYHSVENIGIIVLGLGLGLLGIHYHNVPLAVPGVCRQSPPRSQPRRLQEPPVPRGRLGPACDRHRRDRRTWAGCGNECR